MNRERARLEKIDRKKLPLAYRIILKLPKPSLDSFPEISPGIFWTIVVPVFLILEFFLSLFLLVALHFPVNIIFAGIVPTVVFLIFARITVERLINSFNAAIADQGFEWNIEKVTNEYLDCIDKQKTKKEKDS